MPSGNAESFQGISENNLNRALSAYAACDQTTRGRLYKEEASPLRSEYQRDRDRIVHCSAFRRLEYKTQVFVNHEGDMFRNRLTHSLEVSQIGRTVARALSLNEDLTEAICLAHDLGHTPFGHAGQDALNQCMREHGGFEHNLQSLRVVDKLEEKYADFRGLNLTFETREGILKHCSTERAKTLGQIGLRFLEKKSPCLEAQVANIADEIAYNNHDVDDGLRSGLITLEALQTCSIIDEHVQFVRTKWPAIEGRALVNELIRRMINSLVTDLVKTSMSSIQTSGIETIDDVRNISEPLIRLGEDIAGKHKQLKKFLNQKLYRHHNVQSMADRSKQIIKTLFEVYCEDPAQFGKEQNHNGKNIESNVRDYIAGMTDRFAMQEFSRITSLL